MSLNGVNTNGFQGDPRQQYGINHFSGFTQIQAPPEMKKHLPEIAMMIYSYIASRANNNRLRCIHFNMLVAENGTNPELQILTMFVGNLAYMKIKEGAFNNLSQAVNACVTWVVDRRINFITINDPNLFSSVQDIAQDIKNQASEYVAEADNVANFLSNTYVGGHVSANQGFGGNNVGGVTLSGFGSNSNSNLGMSGFGGSTGMSGFGSNSGGNSISNVITRVDNSGNIQSNDNKFDRDMVGMESQFKEAPKKVVKVEEVLVKKEEKPVVEYYQNGKPNLEVCSETNNPWYSSIFQPFAICYNKRQFAAINKLLPSKDGKKNFVISTLRGLDMDRSEHTLPTTEHFLGLVVPEKVNNVVVMDRNDFIDKSLAKAVTDLQEVREVKSENEFLTSINRFRENSIVTIKSNFGGIEEALAYGRMLALRNKIDDFGVYNIEFNLEKNFAIHKSDAKLLMNLDKSTSYNSLISKLRCIIEDNEASHSIRVSAVQINSYLGAKFIEFIKFYLCIEEFHGMDSFIDDALDLINIVGEEYGQTYKETIIAAQQRFINTYLDFSGFGVGDIDILKDPNDENQVKEDEEVTLLTMETPAIIACTEFLDSELALAVPRYIGATFTPKTISEGLYNLFNELVKNNYSVGLGKKIKRFFLATIDDKVYEVNVGLGTQAPLLIRKIYM